MTFANPPSCRRISSAIASFSCCPIPPALAGGAFIANLIVHEFEGFLFSQPKAFEQWFDEDITRKLQTIRNDVPSPEHINDNKQTAPSKRILQICEGYSKVLHGTLIALDIGLDAIRKECPVFHAWLEKIENLGDSA